MYVRLVRFSLETEKRPAAQTIENKEVPAIRAQKGCERFEFTTDDAAGDYGLAVFWASQDAADAADNLINPMLTTALYQAGAESKTIRQFQIYQP